MIIDCRLRPLFGGFLRQLENAAGQHFNQRLGMPDPKSVLEKSEKLMLAEMDAAGISIGIAPGRNGHFRYNLSNDEVVEMVRHYKGRFVGIAGINGADTAQALKDIDKYVIKGPLKGINMEPGSMPDPWYANDKRLYPIYEKCQEHSIPVMLMLGGRAGPDVSYSSPVIISTLARDFPRINFFVSHGGWPWVQAILGACFWQENIYIAPDLYFYNAPGQADYIAAANTFLQDRFMFGTGYPLMPLKECVEQFCSKFNQDILEKLLWQNVARLFKIEGVSFSMH